MLSKVLFFSCLLAVSYAAPTADAEAEAEAEADPQLLLGGGLVGAGLLGAPAVAAGLGAVAAPYGLAAAAIPGPVPAPLAVAPNCAIEHEELVTQVCTPRAETVCETKEVIAQTVEYEKLCKEVTSKHCANLGSPVSVVKREAEADAEADPWYGYAGHAVGYAHVPAVVAHEETITSPCHEVVSEHCVDNPKIVEVPTPIEQCHVVHLVDCVDQVQKIPKTVCTETEAKVVRHVAAPIAAHPFAYGHGLVGK
jgi:hypothetical protein